VGWQGILDAIDDAESWLVGQSFWVQVPILLAVLGPLSWLAAGLIDRLVELLLRRHRRRRNGDGHPARPVGRPDVTDATASGSATSASS
jgi:hypothetical protein